MDFNGSYRDSKGNWHKAPGGPYEPEEESEWDDNDLVLDLQTKDLVDRIRRETLNDIDFRCGQAITAIAVEIDRLTPLAGKNYIADRKLEHLKIEKQGMMILYKVIAEFDIDCFLAYQRLRGDEK